MTFEGSFLPEPAWGRLDRDVVAALRDWPASRGVDWESTGGWYDWAAREYYSLVEEAPTKLYRHFATLALGNEQSIRSFVRDWGAPVVEVQGRGSEAREGCPVLKVQYEAFRLRLLLRMVRELRAPNPNAEALARDVAEVRTLTGQSAQSYYARGEHRKADAATQEAAGAVASSFHGSLGAVNPVLVVVAEQGRVALTNSWECGTHRAMAGVTGRGLLDYLYLQAYEDLAEGILLQCGCGRPSCPADFFGSHRQVKSYLAGKRVYMPGHKNRRVTRYTPTQQAENRERMRRLRARRRRSRDG